MTIYPHQPLLDFFLLLHFCDITLERLQHLARWMRSGVGVHHTFPSLHRTCFYFLGFGLGLGDGALHLQVLVCGSWAARNGGLSMGRPGIRLGRHHRWHF